MVFSQDNGIKVRSQIALLMSLPSVMAVGLA